MRLRSVAVPMIVAVLALAGPAACGRSSANSGIATAGGAAGPSASPKPSRSVDPEEQGREFAACMREHGVDMPDPETVAGGGIRITASGGPMQKEKMDGAMAACRDKLPNGGTPPSLDPQQQEQIRAFAQCMREHGVDMPDPNSDAGGLVIGKDDGQHPGLRPDDPAFQAAEKACQDKLPGAIFNQSTGGGK